VRWEEYTINQISLFVSIPDNALIDGNEKSMKVQRANNYLVFTLPHFFVHAAIDPGTCFF
jgi:hypothetical protein